MTLSKEDRNIILADLWERLREGTPEREGLIQEIAEAVRGSDPLLKHHRAFKEQHGENGYIAPYVPLGLELAIPTEWDHYQIPPPDGYQYYVPFGVRSFNKPGEIWVEEVGAGTCWPRRVKNFDSASFSLDHGAFKGMPVERHLSHYRTPAAFEPITEDGPLHLQFRLGDRGEPTTKLRWTLYGIGFQPVETSCVPLYNYARGALEEPR